MSTQGPLTCLCAIVTPTADADCLIGVQLKDLHNESVNGP